MWSHRQLAVLVLLLLGRQQGKAALEPIGAAAACGEGQVYRVTCFTDRWGYIADMQYTNTVRNTPVSLCNAQDWQLQAAQLQTLELSATDAIVSFRACSGTGGGLQGLAFVTALGAELTCGSVAGGSCRSFSSRSTYPLRGMQAACQTQSTASGRVRGDEGLAVATRVSSITAACWTPRRQPRSQECLPGQGVRGGGLPCKVCPVNQYSPGSRSPCKPCPPRTTTLTAGQSKCGCFPGEGVYGPVNQDPEVCEECPGGTYSEGGALAPCQPCSTNAFDYLTSAPGSRSIADCVCAAGYGITPSAPTTCSLCRDGYFNEGPMPWVAAADTEQLWMMTAAQPSTPAPGETAAWSAPWLPQSGTGQDGAAERALADVGQSTLRSLKQLNPVLNTPTFSPCVFCGRGCSTHRPGANSPQACTCVVIPQLSPVPVPSPSPLPSPSPSISPSPSPLGPSPSPSPGPSPPPPSPGPVTSQCISCDVNALQQTMANLCQAASGTAVFAIISPSGPCMMAAKDATWYPQGWSSVPNVFTNGLVDCSLVRQLPGSAALVFSGLAPSGGSCTMPSIYNIVIPVVQST